jgi:hypothetical protein
MNKKTWLLSATLMVSGAALADSPFDGTWALNTAKSHLAGDIISLKDADGGALTFTDSAQTYTFKTDGIPFVTPMGVERTFKKTADGSYEATNKRNGTLLSTSVWQLSADGKTLTISSHGTKPNGDSFQNSTTYARTAGTGGLAGEWKSTEVKLSSPNTRTYATEGKDDLTVSIAALKITCKAKLDGKEYPATGPTVPDGLTLAFVRTGPTSLKMVQRVKTKVIYIERLKVSADGKTMVGRTTDGAGKEPETEVWEKQS